MIKRVDDVEEWAVEVAQRLKRVRDSWVDQPIEVQRLNVDEELEFCLADVGAQSGDLRDELISALAKHEALFLAKIPENSEVEKSTEGSDSTGSGLSVEQLLEAWNEMNLGDRDEFKKKAGLADVVDFGELVIAAEHFKPLRPVFQLPLEEGESDQLQKISKEYRDDFQINGEKKMSLAMVLNLSMKLGKSYQGLQPIMKQLWEEYIPREKKENIPLARNGDIIELIARYVENWNGVGEQPLQEELDQVQQMILALVAGVSNAASDFGEMYSRIYSPDDIENLVASETDYRKGGKSKNFEFAAWEKYCELAKNITPDYIDEEFKQIFGNAMARWLLDIKTKNPTNKLK